jgi:2-polyprenyl-3-methyl-5-hydroxy-6-metoxy-1,4-benzoquinol methylase
MNNLPKKQTNDSLCRLCKNKINSESVLSMNPFPKAAQYYPEQDEFNGDSGITLEVYRCPYCDLLQLCSEPVNYYKEVITAASFSKEARSARVQEFTEFVNSFGLNGKSAIEIGSGKGSMINVLKDAGLDASGLEYSRESVDHAKKYGHKIIHGYLSELGNEYDKKFDAFISINYIEHQPDTMEFIRSLYRITKADAVGYVTAPNVSYLLKTNTLYEFVADHLVYFTEETMQRAFETNGFDVIKSVIINNENDIALTVKKRNQIPIEGIESVDKLIGQLSKFIKQNILSGKKIAIWGAGHRTLALLSLAKIDNISFIVDSADFKQGKYSPVMHTPIVSPSVLEDSDIDIVIVMVPGIYPDEVVNTIYGFNKSFQVYKVKDNLLVSL